MKTYKHRENVITASMDGELVMMDIKAGQYYNLGEVGGRIWQLLDQPHTLDELVDLLTKEYNVSAEQCKKDTIPFIEKMLSMDLLVEE